MIIYNIITKSLVCCIKYHPSEHKGSVDMISFFHNFDPRLKLNDQLHHMAALNPEKISKYRLNMRFLDQRGGCQKLTKISCL